MNSPELPLEVIDEILKRLDSISLAKSRQVCRSWRDLHSQPQYKLLWKQACFRDIDKDVLTELTGNRCIAADDDSGGLSGTSKNIQGENIGIDWEAIYKKWFRGRHIGRWPSMVTELKGHKGPVYNVKFSGDRVVTCGDDGTIRIWDSWTSHCLVVLAEHNGAVLSISLRQIPGLSAQADIPHDLIVSGSVDCTVKVWDMKTPSVAAVLTCHGHTNCIYSVAVRENTAASASEDCSVRVWNIVTGHCCHTLSNLGDWATHVKMGLCDTLLSVTGSSQLGLWSTERGELLSSVNLTDTLTHDLFPVTPGVQDVALRGKTALIITCLNGLCVWENRSDGGSVVYNFSLIDPHSNGVKQGECLAMHGALVAIGTRSGAVYVYHLNGNWENQFTKVHCVLPGDGSLINAVSIDDDGEGPSLVTGGDNGVVRVYRWFPPSI